MPPPLISRHVPSAYLSACKKSSESFLVSSSAVNSSSDSSVYIIGIVFSSRIYCLLWNYLSSVSNDIFIEYIACDVDVTPTSDTIELGDELEYAI